MSLDLEKYKASVYVVLAIGISLIIAASLMPTVLQLVSNQTLTSVNSAVITLWHIVVPVVAVVALILLFLGYEYEKSTA